MVLIMTSIIQVLGETECNGTRKLKSRFELNNYYGNIVRYVEKIDTTSSKWTNTNSSGPAPERPG